MFIYPGLLSPTRVDIIPIYFFHLNSLSIQGLNPNAEIFPLHGRQWCREEHAQRTGNA